LFFNRFGNSPSAGVDIFSDDKQAQPLFLVSIHKWPFLPCSAFSAGFRLRRTGVRLTENPCAALIRTKIAHF